MISQPYRQLLLSITVFILSTASSSVPVQAQDYQDGGDYQDYQDYADGYAQQDNLYADYAMKQQEKAVG